MRFKITFRDGRTERVDGDELAVESSGVSVIFRDTTVMNRPRRVVARRLLASEGAVVVREP
jgi:hypothetical protein